MSGSRMPALGLGTWELTGPPAVGAVTRALELGYRLIDTACDYGSEAAIAAALRSTSLDRDEVFLVSKVEEHEDALDGIAERMAALGIQQLDLCLIHRPPPTGAGKRLWNGLIEARRQGLVRDIGVSNYSVDLLERLAAATDERPVVNQIEWSPFGHSDKLQEYADRAGIVLQAYSPLTRGERLEDATLRELGARHDKTPAQILVRWSLQRGTPPIPKAGRGDHLQENIAALEFELEDDEMARLDDLNEHWSSLGGLPYV